MAQAAKWDRLWLEVDLATMDSARPGYGAIEDGAIATSGGTIAWVGKRGDLQGPAEELAHTVIHGGGRWMTPGLIDCHTHIVYGGDRIGEFEARLNGASYEDIARSGGGIVSSVRATRAASEEELFDAAKGRLERLIAEGVTTVEIKSGYGLDLANELKMLRVARRLGRELPVSVVTTLLAAHALPPEYQSDRAGYVDLICGRIVPEAAREGLADAVDAYCEGIGFTPAETAAVFEAARQAGLPVKLHADQLSDLGGAGLAAEYGALSADHVEWTSAEGVRAMAGSETVAVLLPGAFHTLREVRQPPIEAFRAHGVPMAIATDCNPGTSPALSILLMLNMACTYFRLTPAEALAGVTVNAARALGLSDRGTLTVGARADLALWSISQPAELCYYLGARPEVEVHRACD